MDVPLLGRERSHDDRRRSRRHRSRQTLGSPPVLSSCCYAGLLLSAFAAGPRSAPSQSVTRDSIVYHLSPASQLDVKTGKAGLFGFAGHEHLIRARGFAGRVVYYPGAPTASRVDLTVRSDSLQVLTPPDTAEIRKVTEAMRTETLRVEQYPTISFTSKTVAPADSGFRLVADLTLVGQTREVPVDVRVAIGSDTLRAWATFGVKQTDFGIKPFRGGPAGTVRVADRVTFEIEAVAVREP
ncbi:MAG TPA: YceI family protein [Gemmatimonadales bacterium]|nr:YceI family protein [Gemmatimonadales bacterium]